MKRVIIQAKTYIIGYHTQEFRYHKVLETPIECRAKDAWLGKGYYFWVEENFAHNWGQDFKNRKSGFYDVYQGNLDTEKCINATFDEKGYYFFKNSIESAIKYFENNGVLVTLEQVNRFLADYWKKLGVTGIIYDDLPRNRDDKNRFFSNLEYIENHKKQFFYYHKRIQIVIFDLKNIHNFELHLKKQN